MRRPRASAQRLDLHALRAGIAGPGLDTRSWIEMARIDDDPDAVVWDDHLGWLCDVTIESGGLAGEGPINCSVLGACDQGRGVYQPLHPGDRVVVALISGDPNVDAVVIGRVHDVDQFLSATTINGDSIVETNATAGQVAADSTHIVQLQEEDVDIQAGNLRVCADAMVLGAPDADQPFVRGTDQADALGDLADAISSFAAAIAVAPVAGAVVALDVATLAQFQTAVQQFKAARQSYLSTRINGD